MKNKFKSSMKEFADSAKFSECRKAFPELEEKRKAFVEKFPPERIRTLTLEEYCIGGGNKNSFCYGLEYGLDRLGTIRGSYSQKFGVWFSNKSGKYEFVGKWKCNSPEETLKNVLEEIVKLLDCGKRKDIKGIEENRIAEIVKIKLLATYYPESFLCVSSSVHLNFYAEVFGLKNAEKLSSVKQNAELMKLKNSDSVAKEWNNYFFMCFLYECILPEEKSDPEDFDRTMLGEKDSSYYIEKNGTNKIRAESRKVFKQLKKLYGGVCQICGEDTVKKYGCDITEGHHIEYFSIGQISGGQNLMCLCPNCHRMIHKLNPDFNGKKLCYKFKNGEIRPLVVNKHLK